MRAEQLRAEQLQARAEAAEKGAAEAKLEAEASVRELQWQLAEAEKGRAAQEAAVEFFRLKAEARLQSNFGPPPASPMPAGAVPEDSIGEEERSYHLEQQAQTQRENAARVAKLRDLLLLEQKKSRAAEAAMNDALLAADRAASEQEREEAAYDLLAKTRGLLAGERQVTTHPPCQTTNRPTNQPAKTLSRLTLMLTADSSLAVLVGAAG